MLKAVAIVGRSGVGKTTLIEGLLPELVGRGLKVATVKHTHHRIAFDQTGSDTDRHLRAGACSVLLSGPGLAARMERPEPELSLADCLCRAAGVADLVLVEGFKGCDLPRIEVIRRALSSESLLSPEEMWLAVTDTPIAGVDCLDLCDYAGIAQRIVSNFCPDGRLLEVVGVELNAEQRRTLLNLLDPGAGEIRITLRRGPGEPPPTEVKPGRAPRHRGETGL